MKKKQLEMLQKAFEYADEYVLSNTRCREQAGISNGYCDVWAKAVKRLAPFVTVEQQLGHYFIVVDGVGYDADTYGRGGFDPDIEHRQR